MNITYVDVKDSDAHLSNSLYLPVASNSNDTGHNLSWTITTGTCPGNSSSATATANSFQRKTFYDATNSRHWMFFYDGTQIAVRYSSDAGSNWISITPVAYNTNDFSVWNTTISGTAYVFLAVTDTTNFDVVVKRGTLSTTGITWGSASLAFSGASSNDTYAYPYISLDSSNFLWVMAQYYNGTNYVIKTVESHQAGSTDPASGPGKQPVLFLLLKPTPMSLAISYPAQVRICTRFL